MLPALSKEKTSEYMTAQIKEMLGEFNRWITGVKVGHLPSDEECAYHYIRDGGAEDFSKRWKYQHEDAGS